MNVTKIQGEGCRYMVQSGSDPEQKHLVDLIEDACGCADWTCRHRAYANETGKPYRCKHIRAARECFTDEVLESIKEYILSK